MTGVSGGMLSGKKIRKLRSSSCWKCIKIVNPSITTLFLYHFKYLRSHQADLLALGGGGACAPRPPPLPTGLHCCTGLRRSQKKRNVGTFRAKVWLVSNYTQQVPTSANIVVVPCKQTQHGGPNNVACCLPTTTLRPFTLHGPLHTVTWVDLRRNFHENIILFASVSAVPNT